MYTAICSILASLILSLTCFSQNEILVGDDSKYFPLNENGIVILSMRGNGKPVNTDKKVLILSKEGLLVSEQTIEGKDQIREAKCFYYNDQYILVTSYTKGSKLNIYYFTSNGALINQKAIAGNKKNNYDILDIIHGKLYIKTVVPGAYSKSIEIYEINLSSPCDVLNEALLTTELTQFSREYRYIGTFQEKLYLQTSSTGYNEVSIGAIRLVEVNTGTREIKNLEIKIPNGSNSKISMGKYRSTDFLVNNYTKNFHTNSFACGKYGLQSTHHLRVSSVTGHLNLFMIHGKDDLKNCIKPVTSGIALYQYNINDNKWTNIKYWQIGEGKGMEGSSINVNDIYNNMIVDYRFGEKKGCLVINETGSLIGDIAALANKYSELRPNAPIENFKNQALKNGFQRLQQLNDFKGTFLFFNFQDENKTLLFFQDYAKNFKDRILFVK